MLFRSTTSNPKGSTSNPTSKARDITCFKCQGKGHYMRDCPNNRVMIINDRGEYESESEKEDDSILNDLMDNNIDSDDCVDYEHGASLVVRRTLHVNLPPNEDNQRENLFHTRCLVKGKVCNLIIDGGSCCNIAGTELIEKLSLSTFNHP